MKKLLQAKANHLRYAYRDRDFGSKKRYGFGLKTTYSARKRAFNHYLRKVSEI
jgi:hypothetical protein